MKRHDVEQGSEEWRTLRLGIPTASMFHRIISPARLEPSAQRHRYLAELLVELQTGRPYDMAATSWMGRGTRLEDEARKFYEFSTGVDVELVGFITNDAGTLGGSPDGLVGADGMVEIKCRSAARHIEVLMGTVERVSATQVQGLLWLTGRAWCDVVHYCPGMKQDIFRVERDGNAVEHIAAAVTEFAELLDVAKAQVG